MVDQLVAAGGHVGLIAAVLLGFRAVLITIVVLWSLRTDEAGRKHALALLRVLGAGTMTRRLSNRP